jgi:hypothetical protein
MIEHPDPPADFDGRELLIREVEGPLFRIHQASQDPLHCGRAARYRFDAPAGEFGVLYCAEDEWGAFIETFDQSTGISTVSVSSLTANPLAKLSLSRPLRVVDFAASGGLTRAGADARLCSGPQDLARRWSLAIRGHPAHADGIAYGCRHDPPRVALAVFDHAADAVSAQSIGPLISPEHQTLLGRILDTYGFGLVE